MAGHDNSPSVAVLVETATSWGRRIIRGVSNYARAHGAWHLLVSSRDTDAPYLLETGWHGDGVIARVSNPKLRDKLNDLGVPVVNVSSIRLSEPCFPRVTVDYEATARLAAEHLLELKCKQLAYVGPTSMDHVARHCDAFARAAQAAGVRTEVFDHRVSYRKSFDWNRQVQELGGWLKDLPKPAGLFCWATETGTRVLDICRHMGIAVPHEVAVLADDDDPLLCETTTPPMSAVLHAADQVGFHAAARLDALMSGDSVSPRDELIGPVDVTPRASTESLMVKDPEMLRAIMFIRDNALHPITIPEVADAVPMGRRSLERKFRATFGRTPLEEIRRLRISRIRELLATTDLSIREVAEKSGFSSPEHMSSTFRRFVGLSPIRYRHKVQGR